MTGKAKDAARDTRLFAIIREIKGSGLTQAEVEKVNKALYADMISEPTRQISPEMLAFIQTKEGFSHTAYPDPGTGGKPWTIGWGSTTNEDGSPIKPGDTWTKDRALKRLLADVGDFERGVLHLLNGAPATQGQFDALVSFAYNVGLDIDEDTKAEGLGDSTLLKKHLAKDYVGAKKEFGKWIYANGEKLNGLIKRRAEEAVFYGR